MTTAKQLTIDVLGSQGEGVAEAADHKVFVSFTLPGERIVAEQGK